MKVVTSGAKALELGELYRSAESAAPPKIGFLDKMRSGGLGMDRRRGAESSSAIASILWR
jgi:hypothetical protein